MKREVQKLLKEKGKAEYFTDNRYNQVYELMKYAMKKDEWLRNYLPLDPLNNKSSWIADHIIKLVELNKI